MPETETERKQLRAGLLDQLRHLVREAQMLEGAIARVPEKLLADAPPGEEHSIKEIFGFIVRLDEAVHPRRIERVAAEDSPRLDLADMAALVDGEDWNAQPIGDLLVRIRTAREALAGTLEATPPDGWLRTGLFPADDAVATAGSGPPGQGNAPEGEGFEERDLYWMAHAICQHDRERLEGIAYRLYESHMGPAPAERGDGGAPPGPA